MERFFRFLASSVVLVGRAIASSRIETVYLPDVLGVPREQADLPAEQPASCEDPRLPVAHAHPCRSCHPGRSSAQGPHRALCLRHVLPAAHRLRRSVDFQRAVRSGVRAGAHTLVVHLVQDSTGSCTPQVGFVVSRAVGNAVHRNAVKRRLRAIAATELDRLPDRSRVVVRALPAAADATYEQLSADLRVGVDHASRRLVRRGSR